MPQQLDPAIFGGPPPGKKCRLDFCDRQRSKGRTLCAGHFGQQQRGAPFAPIRPYRSRKDDSLRPPCAAPGCVRPMLQRGLCKAHYQRQQKGLVGDERPLGPYRAKGTTRDIASRIPREVADAVWRRAKNHRMSISQMVAVVLTAWVGKPDRTMEEG